MGDQEVGRVPDGTGLSSTTEPASSLGPSGFDPSRVTLTWLGGNCPVQAEGFVDGQPFYFRARGDGWEFWVGKPWTAEAFTIAGPYGQWPDAGWMEADCARALIAAGIYAYWHYGRDSDGSPKGGDGEAGSVACDDSAGPKDIAQTTHSHPHSDGRQG